MKTIFVIDDYPDSAALLAEALAGPGRSVVAFTSPTAAVAAFREEVRAGRRIDIVITDFDMPKLTGAEVVEAVRVVAPGVPCIIVSGASDASRAASAIGAMFFSKLGNPRELVRQIGRLLDEAPDAV